ncbi:MAG: hypothetical protein OXR62_11180 [Ahrensia sp.]|nr:hypothetical protein [Ahrensia sp.]
MKRLEDSALIFGRMMRVDEPHMVARYNEALAGFGLPPTKLDAFRIDMTGFSPEVADERGDRQYLDPHGVNRRFIILSPQQMELPVVNSAFSNTGQLLHEFYEANARALNALTIKDVVYGEIEDPILEARDIEDLLSIEQVEFKIFTGQDLTKQALELRLLIDRLKKEEDAWKDDAMLNRMAELAGLTGDIRSNDLVPEEVVFRHNTFWARHFGGVYVFIDERQTTVIGDPSAPGFRRSRPWQVSYIDRADSELVYRFLLETERVEPPRHDWIERSGYIDHRIEMLVTMLAYKIDPQGTHAPQDPRWMRRWLNENASILEQEGTHEFLTWAKRELESWDTIDLEEIDARGRFILSRAKPGHEDVWLVNRLISDYVRFDYVTRYVFNKPAFYEAYESWEDGLRSHTARELSRIYLADKKKLRRDLYGV